MEQLSLDQYIAGFFDSEGYIWGGINKAYGNYLMNPKVRIGQSYIGGMIDGDGNIGIHPNVKRKKLRQFGTSVSILQRIKGENVLQIIQNHLKDMGIHSYIYIMKNKDSVDVVLQISKYKDVKKFLELIYPYSIVKKPQIKIMLEEIMPKIKPNTHSYSRKKGEVKYSKREIIEIMKSVDKMNALKGRRSVGNKYTEQYFRDLWGIYE